MQCPKCNAENLDIHKFCGECGAKLGKVCPVCGTTNFHQYRFCSECGHDLVLAEEYLFLQYLRVGIKQRLYTKTFLRELYCTLQEALNE